MSRIELHDYGLAVGTNVPLPAQQHAIHMHPDVELNLVLDGGITYVMDGNAWHLGPGRLVAFWAGLPHGLTGARRGTSFRWVTVPLALVLQWSVSSTLLPRLLDGGVVAERSDPATTNEDRLMLERWQRLCGGSSYDAGTVLLELEARLRRLATSPDSLVTADGGRAESPQRPDDRVARAAGFIAERYREPISSTDVAKAVGAHPVHLAKVFRAACGISLREYITRLRVAHAQRLLSFTELSVLEVCMEAGFGSASQFYESFSRHCQQTPTEYRQSLPTG